MIKEITARKLMREGEDVDNGLVRHCDSDTYEAVCKIAVVFIDRYGAPSLMHSIIESIEFTPLKEACRGGYGKVYKEYFNRAEEILAESSCPIFVTEQGWGAFLEHIGSPSQVLDDKETTNRTKTTLWLRWLSSGVSNVKPQRP